MIKGGFVTIFASFAVGVSVGWFATSRLLKHRYEKKADEEINKIRMYYANRDSKIKDATDAKEAKKEYKGDANSENDIPDTKVHTSFDANSYKEDLKEKVNYSDYFSKGQTIVSIEDDPKTRSGPYMISPEDFSELVDEGYDSETYYFYNDGVIADADNNVIDNYTEIIGNDCLNHFGDYPEEPDSVFIRNEKLKLDIEVINNPEKSWEDVLEQFPYLIK